MCNWSCESGTSSPIVSAWGPISSWRAPSAGAGGRSRDAPLGDDLPGPHPARRRDHLGWSLGTLHRAYSITATLLNDLLLEFEDATYTAVFLVGDGGLRQELTSSAHAHVRAPGRRGQRAADALPDDPGLSLRGSARAAAAPHAGLLLGVHPRRPGADLRRRRRGVQRPQRPGHDPHRLPRRAGLPVLLPRRARSMAGRLASRDRHRRGVRRSRTRSAPGPRSADQRWTADQMPARRRELLAQQRG